MSDKRDEPQEQQDKTFTTQFSNNVPEELECVDAAAELIGCAPNKKRVPRLEEIAFNTYFRETYGKKPS